jgi:hypothetical protein
MANKLFHTIPGTIDISGNLNTFKNTAQVIWTNNNRQQHGAFTPTHGWRTEFFTDNAHGVGDNNTVNMYSSSKENGQRWTNREIGNKHQQITEVGLQGGANCRWMGANIFNGFGFEIFQSLGSGHALWYAGCALAFYNGSSWRTWGHQPNDGKGKYSGYRHIYMNDSSSINTIRGWGNSWKLTGINFWIQNDGGAGKDTSSLYIYNLRIGSKVTTLGGQYRMIPAGKRSWANRNANSGNVPFTDPFT